MKRQLVYSQIPRGRGILHYRREAPGSAPGSQEAPGSVTRQGECKENVGRSFYCSFHGKELERGDLHRRLGARVQSPCVQEVAGV